MTKALLVIDIQNDYFPDGAFTLENAETACKAAVEAIGQARRDGWLVIGVQHVNTPDAGVFRPGTAGVEIHPAIADALGDAPVVVKQQADSFYQTNLGQLLTEAGIESLYVTGMMTQHCVTHTALSPETRGMKVHILAGGCAAPSQALSDLALKGLDARCEVV